MLNITKLDYFYNGVDVDTRKLNHIHIGMALDSNYFELSLISIASLFNKSHPLTFIHFHILCLDLEFERMAKIIELKKININIDFIFYNAKQAEYDFGEKGRNDWRGVGNYAKILCPKIVNSTEKILIIDSGDTIVQKDISEIFYYNIEDNYFSWILEDQAGNNVKYDPFFRNIFYPNAGVFLVNISLFRNDELYYLIIFIFVMSAIFH
jgi:lipopolysaccharide biosynthesis glycosyltransferase